jgi:hypothetical protein
VNLRSHSPSLTHSRTKKQTKTKYFVISFLRRFKKRNKKPNFFDVILLFSRTISLSRARTHTPSLLVGSRIYTYFGNNNKKNFCVTRFPFPMKLTVINFFFNAKCILDVFSFLNVFSNTLFTCLRFFDASNYNLHN